MSLFYISKKSLEVYNSGISVYSSQVNPRLALSYKQTIYNTFILI